MNKYFYRGVPTYLMNRFCAVRDSMDNLKNVLNVSEIINTQYSYQNADGMDFDIAIFVGDYKRILVKGNSGYFSMGIPFQVILKGDQVCFNSDFIEEEVNGRFISIMKNCIQTTKNTIISHEDVIFSLIENFNLDISEAIKYYEAFTFLIAEDNGYFRFDDDPKNEKGDIHPRYHFDIFYNNTTSIKIGYDCFATLGCFYSLMDHTVPKKYLRDRK